MFFSFPLLNVYSHLFFTLWGYSLLSNYSELEGSLKCCLNFLQSVQFCHSFVPNSLWPHGWQHARLLCLHHLPEFALTHVYRVSDAIQLSHPLLSPFLPAFNLSQHQGLFQWASLWQKGTEHWKRNFPKKKSIKYLGYGSKRRVKFPKQSTQAGQDKPGLLIQFIFKITQKGTVLVLETREGLVVQSPGDAWLFATPWTLAHQAPLSSFSNVS